MKDESMSALPLSKSGREALEVATKIVKEAGGILKAHFLSEKEIRSKGKRNLVTDVDLLVEKHIVTCLRNEFPDHGILAEESSNIVGDGGYLWILDPLDGTANYTYKIPFFSISLALTYKEEVLLGLIYEPLREELFWAQKGKGAFLNKSPLVVPSRKISQATIVGFDLGYDDERTREILALLNSFWSGEKGFRIMGSAALGLAYVACGRLDIYLHPSVYPWDIAGGLLLINEVGGEVIDWGWKPATIRSKKVFAFGKNNLQTAAAIMNILKEHSE